MSLITVLQVGDMDEQESDSSLAESPNFVSLIDNDGVITLDICSPTSVSLSYTSSDSHSPSLDSEDETLNHTNRSTLSPNVKRNAKFVPASAQKRSIQFKLPSVPSMFQRKKEKDKFGSKSSKNGTGLPPASAKKEEDRMSNESGGATSNVDPSTLSNAELRLYVRQVLKDRDMPAERMDDFLDKMTEDSMRLLITQNRKADMMTKKSPRQLVAMLWSLLEDGHIQSRVQDVLTIKVLLAGADVAYVQEFATTILPDEGHRANGLQLIGLLISNVLSHLYKSDGTSGCKDLYSVLSEAVRCLRVILNTVPGIELALRHDDHTLLHLLEVLMVVNRRSQTSETMSLRRDVIRILASIVLIDDERLPTIENSGASKLMKGLQSLCSTSEQSRFHPLLSCLEFCSTVTEDETLHRVLVIVNVLINRSHDNLDEDQAWQMRMRMRSEMVRDGLGKHMTNIEAVASQSQKVDGLLKQYNDNRDDDFQELVGRFETIRGEYESLNGVFELLASSTQNSAAESVLLSILQHLMLVPDDVSVRLAYFRLIESCVSEIVLHKNGVDPDFGAQFRFETPVAEMIEQLQDSEVSRKLEQTVQAKQEAVAMQMQYWKKLAEFRTEAEQLRKHISDASQPVPPPTACTLQAPCTSSGSSSSLPPVTGGPPPPGGLPPITGGPPPPPPPGGLPRVTGGPPPPPPPPGCGAPPPPPPPPPPGLCGKGGPPGPPPPPPGLFGKGPPGPPPPPSFSGPPMPPAIPEYLPAKKRRMVEVPMRKFPWGSNSLNPRDLPQDCFWAHVAEEKLANDSLLNELKEKFSSSRPGAKSVDSKTMKAMKKVRVAQVIHDEKCMKALEILNASVKLSHKEWKRIILELDEKALSAVTLSQLRAALPPVDILKKLAEVDQATYDEMPDGEQMVATLAKIRQLPLRLDLFVFKLRFREIQAELTPGITSVIEACESLRHSKGFKMFLELALLYGNFMGQSSKTHKDIFGFEMSVLPKIADTKDVENHRTLLHYMVDSLRKIDPRKAKFVQEDFYHCVSASRVNKDEIDKGVNSLKQTIRKLESALSSYEKQDGKDHFMDVMKPFFIEAQTKLELVATMHAKMCSDWSSLTKYYAFNEKKYSMEQFFTDMKAFKEQYETAYRDLEQERVLAEKEKEKKEKKKDKRAPLTTIKGGNNSQTATPGGPLRTNPSQAGVLDELDKVMETGNLKTFLMGARTPKSVGVGAGRTRKGQLALSRQRSRNADQMLAEMNSGPLPPRLRLPSDDELEAAAPKQRVVRVRTRGGPAVEAVRPVRQSQQQISPSHKENRQETTHAANGPPSATDLLSRLKQL